MARKITGVGDTAIINSELKRLDQFQKTINEHTQQLQELIKHNAQIRDARAIPSTNNLVFTWTGGSLTLSWSSGYVQDSSLRNYPVIAGSIVVAASTNYWLAWNSRQLSMAFSTSLQTLVTGVGNAASLTPTGGSNVASGNNLVICEVFTGTAGQSGTAGGGGSDPGGVGQSGKEYKLF